MKENIISVIIPVGKNEKRNHYINTINSLIKNTKEDIEILFLADGWIPKKEIFKKYNKVRVISSSINLGERRTVNRGAKKAKGEYIFRVDAHCKMSREWDVKLKKICTDNNLVVCSLDALDKNKWDFKGHNYNYVYINSDIEEKWWGKYHSNDKRKTHQSTMSLTGCGWLCKTDFFLNNLQFDEDLGKWGCIGPEMSAKVEKSKGEILLHKEVRCGHVFNTNVNGYPVPIVSQTRKEILKRYGNYIYDLAQKFKPVPTWNDIIGYSSVSNNFLYKTDIIKKDISEVKDKSGNVVERIIKIYKPICYKKNKNDISSIKNQIIKNTKLKKIKILKLVDNIWKFQTINKEKDIKEWLNRNE